MNNVAEYVRLCDRDFEKRLSRVSEALSGGDARFICLSGPTCSGKTTAARMLSERLCVGDRRVHTVSIDDFYFDREHLAALSNSSGDGDVDYDSEATIDLALLERFVEDITQKGEAECPVFDFKTGNREGFRRMCADRNDLFIFEGIQAIYGGVKDILSVHGSVGVYICPMTPLRCGEYSFLPNDIRLLRRLVRDAHFRATEADLTLTLWSGVRENEERSIFPFTDACKYKIDSTHGYEIGVLKPFLDSILGEIPSESKNKEWAMRILRSIADATPIDSKYIEDGSLYKEFV